MKTPGGTPTKEPRPAPARPESPATLPAPPTKTEQKEQENNTMTATQTARPAQTAPADATKAQANQGKRTFSADRISDKTRAILHKAIDRGTRAAAGWTGTPLAVLAATADPESERGKTLLIALDEAERRAYRAIVNHDRYKFLESNGEEATIRTPKQLDPLTGSWSGMQYKLKLETGHCSCQDHEGTLAKINHRLMQHAPDAAPVVCKHFIILAIMAANRELTLPDRATPTASDPDERNETAREAWEIWYHDGDPEKSRIFAHSLTHSKAIAEANHATDYYADPDRAAKFPSITFEIRPAAPAPAAPTTKAHKGDF